MDKNTQRLVTTVITLGILVAIFIYLKKNWGKFGFNLGLGGGSGDGSSGSASAAQAGTYQAAAPDYRPAAVLLPHALKPKGGVLDALHIAAQKLSVAVKGQPDGKDYSAMLFDADKTCEQFLKKYGKDPKISWDLFQFGSDYMNAETFKTTVIAWLKKAHYKSIKDTNLFKCGASNDELAIFINRALNEAKIR
jgi:hypothetical protein